MKTLTPTQAAYVAGFLDGDGSIFVRLKPNAAYKYGFQIAPYIVFFQSAKETVFLERLQEMIGAGYVRLRNDGIAELTIGSIKEMRNLIQQVEPYLILKKQQARLLVQILERKEQVCERRTEQRINAVKRLAVSTGWQRRLPALHIRPIDLVVFQEPSPLTRKETSS